ncbi:MAG: response regulator [Lachnospiraceae bacterium]|nr:response regulator [Lachnospiraceae bacterium]MBP3569974.1 response regulator [Lachnospiraceae bacterium]
MKVLFIDDEPLIRKGLQVVIPWAQYGFTEFLEAEDGPEGLKLIEEEHPDLVLLDIHMETMSGLSVAKKAREQDFSGRIVILSGYSDFEYAKSAIDYGVTSYLLKPVDPEQLTEAVLKSIDELNKERLVSIYADQPASMAKSAIITGLLTGTMAYTAEMETIYHLGFSSGYFRVVLLLSEDAEKSKLFPVKNYLSAAISGNCRAYIVTGPAQEQALKKQLTEYENELIAVFSSKAESHTELHSLYQAAESVVKNMYYYKNNKSNLLYAETVLPVSSAEDFNLITFTETLLSRVLLLEPEQTEQDLAALTSWFLQRRPPRDSIGFILQNCYNQVTSKLFEQYPKLTLEIADKDKFTSHLYADRYLCDSIAFFNRQLQTAIAFIKTSSQASPCQRICQYIDEHLSDPLKLDSIAKQFGYNSAYLGKLFAKETGRHFNVYLDERRIELARDYLEKGFSVAQTCELSGFTNTDYFTKKFKKYVGTLPSEYKKSRQ